MTTTLTPDKKAWADAHIGKECTFTVHGQWDSYTVLDNGDVLFHAVGGTISADTVEPDGTDGTHLATPPLSAEEIAAQIVAQDAARQADEQAAQAAAAEAAAQRQAEIQELVDQAVNTALTEHGIDPSVTSPPPPA